MLDAGWGSGVALDKAWNGKKGGDGGEESFGMVWFEEVVF